MQRISAAVLNSTLAVIETSAGSAPVEAGSMPGLVTAARPVGAVTSAVAETFQTSHACNPGAVWKSSWVGFPCGPGHGGGELYRCLRTGDRLNQSQTPTVCDSENLVIFRFDPQGGV